MSQRIEIRAKRVPGFRRDEVVGVDADDEGIPLDRFWRRRLRDAKRDGCCEVVAAPTNTDSGSDDE